MSTEDRAVKLHEALTALEDAAIEYAKMRKEGTRWQAVCARRELVRAAVRNTKAIERARKDRGR